MTLRHPTAADAAGVWRLIGRGGGLERNSCYAYLLLCSHFAETCIVAEREGALAGMVLAYRPPARPDEIFVWQVGVAPEARGTGLGGRLLDALLEAPACAGVRFLTATVSPDNHASRSLFRSVARRREAPFAIERGFAASLFAEPHEDEDLVRIGPLLPRS